MSQGHNHDPTKMLGSRGDRMEDVEQGPVETEITSRQELVAEKVACLTPRSARPTDPGLHLAPR